MNAARHRTDQADDRETPITLARKLREIGYQEPILPRNCAVTNCDNVTYNPERVTCEDCAAELQSLAESKKTPRGEVLFWCVLAFLVIVLGVGALIGWCL